MTDEEILMKNRDGCTLSLLKHSFDEEKAEEYINKNPSAKILCPFEEGRIRRVKDALLYGLAEGRKEGYEQGYEDCRYYAHDYYKPKWHDLRKNPEDLPKKDCDVALKVYNYRTKEIITDSGFYKGNMFYHWKSGYRILAWVELPLFEE